MPGPDAKFEKIFESAPVAIAITSVDDGRFLEVNPMFEELTGYSRDEAVGATTFDLGIWEHPEERVRVVEEIRRTGKAKDVEAVLRRKGGQVFTARFSAEIMEIDSTSCLLTFVVDVTDRRRSEVALAESESRFRNLFEQAGDAIITIRDGRFSGCNAKALELFRCTYDELSGASPWKLSPAYQGDGIPSRITSLEKISQAMKGEPQFFPWRHRRCDGTEFDAEVSLSSHRYGDKEEVLAIVRDVSFRKTAEERIEILNTNLASRAAELQMAYEEMEDFAHTVSHDLREPLIAVGGFAAMLLKLDPYDPKWRQYTEIILDSSHKMEQLIDVILSFSRIARSTLSVQRVDISAIAEESIATLRARDPERKVNVSITPGLAGWGDRRLLGVVMDNLVGNAWKYTEKTGDARIEIGVSPDGSFYVRDNGAGFDPAREDELFKPFCRLHTDREFPGTGVGLATVQRIIRRHGGRIWAKGSPGNGAMFSFTLPDRADEASGEGSAKRR